MILSFLAKKIKNKKPESHTLGKSVPQVFEPYKIIYIYLPEKVVNTQQFSKGSLSYIRTISFVSENIPHRMTRR